MTLELDDDGDLTTALWDAKQAAVHAGVKPVTIRQWVYRGHLKQAADSDGKPLYRRGVAVYRALDVARAEKATRQAARRWFPAGAAA